MDNEEERAKSPSGFELMEEVDSDHALALALALQEQERAFTMLETTESETESDLDYLGESFSHSSDEFLFRLDFEVFNSSLAADPPEFLQDESSESDQMEEDEIDPDQLSYEELIALGEIVGEESRGLSEEQISSSLHPYVCKNVDCKATIDRCVICQVEYDEGEEIVALQCEHPFHADCIAKWLQIKKVCPICSAEATMNQKSK
ncbi:hypothetical protein Ancab_038728 [Ancistrocladus abbreviatus]